MTTTYPDNGPGTIQHGLAATPSDGELHRRDVLPAPVRALIAELAIAEKWPTPEGWCSKCGFGPCMYSHLGKDCRAAVEPQTLATWANILTARIEDSTEGLDLRLSQWTTAQAELARAIAAQLISDADYSDRQRAARSA